MAIGPVIGPTGQAGVRPQTRRTTGSTFSVPADVADSQATHEAAPVVGTSLAAMLALQEVENPTERDTTARQHAEDMLDELQGLQIDLLGAEADPERLERLARLVRSLPVATHPGLRAAVASVALRAGVELTRLDIRSAAHGGQEVGQRG
jgi:hypothetical protein